MFTSTIIARLSGQDNYSLYSVSFDYLSFCRLSIWCSFRFIVDDIYGVCRICDKQFLQVMLD